MKVASKSLLSVPYGRWRKGDERIGGLYGGGAIAELCAWSSQAWHGVGEGRETLMVTVVLSLLGVGDYCTIRYWILDLR